MKSLVVDSIIGQVFVPLTTAVDMKSGVVMRSTPAVLQNSWPRIVARARCQEFDASTHKFFCQGPP